MVLLPSGRAQSAPELVVGAMGSLPNAGRRRSEDRGRVLDAESLLLEEDVRSPILLRHPAELPRHHPDQVARERVGLRGTAVTDREPVALRRVAHRAEIFATSPPVSPPVHLDRP